MDRKTFVIVHGAWGGAWEWAGVRDRLNAAGHRVHVPTLSGLAERSHLDPETITFSTHVSDVANEIRWGDLTEVVLVAHSYGGFVAAAALEQIGPQVSAVAFVDAFIPKDGQRFGELFPGWTPPKEPTIPPMESGPGSYEREEDRLWASPKATPQPSGTFTEAVRLTGALDRVPRRTFIQATGWSTPLDGAMDSLARAGWRIEKIGSTHNVAIDRPDELTALLVKAAG